MKTFYAIGDIHGEIGKLERLLLQIEADAGGRAGEKLGIFLGDYIDRGPDSRAVVELVASGRALSFPYLCLSGNHEDMALNDHELWAINGAGATLRSYGGAISVEHEAWMRSLRLFHREGKWLFVHAGIEPGRPLADQRPHTMMWIRDPFLLHEGPFAEGVIVVHGHTPSRLPEVEANRINIDTGAVYGGHLTCAVLTDRLEKFLQA